MLMFTESSCSVNMIYLDFSKAFDKEDYGVLLHKLRDMGIAGNLGCCCCLPRPGPYSSQSRFPLSR